MKFFSKVLLVLMVFITAITPVLIATELATVTITGTYNYDYAKQVIEYVNIERVANGLNELVVDDTLMEAAMTRASECALLYAHLRPTGEEVKTVTSKLNGENIGAGYTSAYSVMYNCGWMDSVTHRANILNSAYKSIGVGCYYCNGKYYWVQIFSTKSATSTSEYSGVEANVTEDLDISSDYIDLEISGLDSTNTLEVGQTLQATTVTLINYGWNYLRTPISLSNLNWSSSDTNIFTVDENGLVTAVSVGTATLIASIGDIEYTFSIEVLADETNSNTENIEDNDENLSDITDDNLDDTELSENSDTNVESHEENINDTEDDADNDLTADKENTQSEFLRGDMNLDGKVNAEDAAMILDIYKNNNATEEDLLIGDMNEDGRLNAEDAAMILDVYKNS